VTAHPARLLLVRHGETDWNRARRVQGQSDIPLNDEGRRQAQRLAARLQGTPVDAIHASDLVRAAETARILGAALGRDPLLLPDWRELHLGELEGADGVEMARRHGELLSAVVRRGRPFGAGGESYADLHRRVVAGYARLCAEHADGTVLVVSHGGTLKALIAHLLGLEAAHIDRLSLRANTGVSEFDFRHGRPQLVLLNDARHLG